jgi:hypothetical protein
VFGVGIDFTVDDDGRLIAVPVTKHCVSIRLVPEGVEAFMSGAPSVRLRWDDHGDLNRAMDGLQADLWTVGGWTTGRYGPVGVGLVVCGRCEEAAAPLLEATSTVWHRFNSWPQRGTWAFRALPIVATVTVFTMYTRERDTLAWLVRVLASRPELRARLLESDRMRRLADDLDHGRIAASPGHSTIRSDSLDVEVAIRKAGYWYPFTRPLSHRQIAPLDEVVEKVKARLDANQYRRDHPIEDDRIRAVVRHVYTDIEPWPFAALVD